MQIATLLTGALAWRPDERQKKSHEMAPDIIPQDAIESWRKRNIKVVRGCIVRDGYAELVVQISQSQRPLSVIRCKKNGGPIEFSVNTEPVTPVPVTLNEFSDFVIAFVKKEFLRS